MRQQQPLGIDLKNEIVPNCISSNSDHHRGKIMTAKVSGKAKEQAALRLVARVIKNPQGMTPENMVAELKKAWHTCPSSEKVLMTVVFTCSDLGFPDQSLEILHQALTIHGETPGIIRLLAKVSKDMGDFSTVEKLFIRLVQLEPDDSESYVHLIEALRKQDKNAEAIEIAKGAVAKFPQNAGLWNQLGLLTQFTLDELEAANEFYKQAIALDPKNADFHHNMSGLVIDPTEARQWLEKAISLAPDNAQIHLSYALLLFASGETEEGWKHYRYRKDPTLGSSKSSQFSHGLPDWNGEPLAGKSIIVCAEQGIGDEIFFMLALPALLKCTSSVFVVCDPRLTDIVERSFPGVKAFAYEDTVQYGTRHRGFPALREHLTDAGIAPDYFTLMGDVMGHFHGTEATYNELRSPYLSPDPTLTAKLSPKLEEQKLKIGISWRSGNLSQERKRMYLELQLFLTLAERLDADFYVLQYSMSDAEAALIDAAPNVHRFPDLDLKQDIEANLAIMASLDVIIGPPVATQSFATAIGKPVWLINKGAPWPFMGKDHLPSYFANGSMWWYSHFHRRHGDNLVRELTEALEAFRAKM